MSKKGGADKSDFMEGYSDGKNAGSCADPDTPPHTGSDEYRRGWESGIDRAKEEQHAKETWPTGYSYRRSNE